MNDPEILIEYYEICVCYNPYAQCNIFGHKAFKKPFIRLNEVIEVGP
jgi:hypothetical protein